MTRYITEQAFAELCDRVNLDYLEVKYTRDIRAVVYPERVVFRVYDFEVLVQAGKKWSMVRVTYKSDSVPQCMVMDFKGKLPVSMSVQDTDFYYSYREHNALQD